MLDTDGVEVRSWTETDLALRCEIYSTGWQTALGRPPKIDVRTVRFQVEQPAVVSLALANAQVPAWGLEFPQVRGPQSALREAAAEPPRPAGAFTSAQADRPSATRVRPPADVIRLEDRLYYLLQPPLETLLSRESLPMPFEPFSYQWQGVAFLYPRYAGILADEMGLGKTMQAITTIRLLMHCGEIRSALLICPKPLMSNWVHEFQLWAPEIPVVVVAGPRHRRTWQWRLPDVPVKIANYELLMRDRDVITAPDLRFDLVVLDEAQRIKNRATRPVRSCARSAGAGAGPSRARPSRTAPRTWWVFSSFSRPVTFRRA